MIWLLSNCAVFSEITESIQAVSEKLKANSFQQRTEAQEALVQMTLENKNLSSEHLLNLYKKTQDPEAKLRIRGVLKDAVLKKNLGSGSGFVGIRMGVRQIEGDDVGLRYAIIILEVNKGTPAETAGLQIGDLILQVDDLVMRKITANDDFVNYITSKKPGDQVAFQIRRAGLEVPVKLTLGRFPEKLLKRQMFRNNGFGQARLSGGKFDDPESRFFDIWLAERLKEDVE